MTRKSCAVGMRNAILKNHLKWKNRFSRWEANWNRPFNWKVFVKREYLQRYYSFLVFTEITGKSLCHILYHTSAMLLGINTRFRSRKWSPPSCLSRELKVVGTLKWTKKFV